MHHLGINGGESREQPANPDPPGKLTFKTVCAYTEKPLTTVDVLSSSF